MALFQCSACGCIENSALTGAYMLEYLLDEPAKQLIRNHFKLEAGTGIGEYCSACNPVWYDTQGKLQVGNNQEPKPRQGQWHGEFDRVFLPKGEFEVGPNGRLMHKTTLDEDVRKYALQQEQT